MTAIEAVTDAGTEAPRPAQTSVKESVFPFTKFPGVDVVLGYIETHGRADTARLIEGCLITAHAIRSKPSSAGGRGRGALGSGISHPGIGVARPVVSHEHSDHRSPFVDVERRA